MRHLSPIDAAAINRTDLIQSSLDAMEKWSDFIDKYVCRATKDTQKGQCPEI